jgi:hypothetical protein
VPAVDPVVTAAWIGAGVAGGVGVIGIASTVITAWIGSRNTRLATERTIAAGAATTAATLAAAHDAWLREKRSAAYEETLAGLLYRQAKRRHGLRGFRWDEATEDELKGVFDNYDPPGLFEAQGRLVAYASDAVRDAFNVASLAHDEGWAQYDRKVVLNEKIRLAQASSDLNIMPNSQEVSEVNRQLNDLMKSALAADQALIKVIRDELRSKPEAAALPVALPAERSRFRRRWQ